MTPTKQMTPDAFRKHLIRIAVLGSLIALTMCIAFGVLDVQCRNNPDGPYWNAEKQQCQAREVPDADT